MSAAGEEYQETGEEADNLEEESKVHEEVVEEGGEEHVEEEEVATQ